MTAQQKLAEVKAEQELEALGWVKGKCPVCINGYLLAPEVFRNWIGFVKCAKCEGSGTNYVRKEKE